MAFHPNEQARLLAGHFDPVAMVQASLDKTQPWESIVDFATHKDFCGQQLYPRQVTLLRLMYLETETMTAYDVDTINKWRDGFKRRRDTFGVQPDVWERIKYLKARGARRFPHIQSVFGRRGSKGFIGGILGCEQLAYFYSLDDWQARYEVQPGKVGYLNVGATSQTQAKMHQFADILATVESCKYLQPHIAESKADGLAIRTPGDVRRIAEMRAAKVPIEHLIATLQVRALSASATAFRGATAFGLFLDEFAFMLTGTGSVKTGEEIYEDAHPSLDQFDLDSLTYLPSSPATKTGKAYGLYQEASVLMSSYDEDKEIGEEALHELQALAAQAGRDVMEIDADPTKLVLQLPSWEPYIDWERTVQLIGPAGPPGGWRKPQQWGPDHETQLRRKERNPEKFAVERAAQWAEVQGAYFDPDMVSRMFEKPDWHDPLSAQSRGYLSYAYRIHCDPAMTGANFAMCAGHVEHAPCEKCQRPFTLENRPCTIAGRCVCRPHVMIDLLHVWRPQDFPPDPETKKRTIDYIQVENELAGVLHAFPSTSKLSFDQCNQVGLIQRLRRDFAPEIRVAEVTFTEKENFRRFERIKTALNMGWVHSYRDGFYEDGGSLLEMELRYLSMRNGRVVKQDVGPCRTKDLCDAFCVVVTDLLHKELDSQASSIPGPVFGSSNAVGLKTGDEFARVAAAAGGEGSAARQQLNAWRNDRNGQRRYQSGNRDRLSNIRARRS